LSRSAILAVLALSLAAALPAAGCGDGGGDSSAFGSPEFAQQLESICAQGRLRGLRYAKPRGKGRSEASSLAVAIKSTLLPSIEREIAEMRALSVPDGVKPEFEALLEAMQRGVANSRKIRHPSFEQVNYQLRDMGHLAKKAGLQACIYSS
jgi:hypothetical protein